MANNENKKKILMIQNVGNEYGQDKKGLIAKLNELIIEGKKNNDIFMIGLCYYFLATIYSELTDRDRLLSFALKAVALLKDCDEYDIKARAYIALGYAYFERLNVQMALECYDEALKIANKHRLDDATKLTIINDLSTCYHALGDSTTSIKLLNECIEKIKIIDPNDYTTLAMFQLNLAENNQDAGKYTIAKQILESMHDWVDKISIDAMQCDYYLRIAVVNYSLGDISSGNKYFDKALKMIPKGYYPHPIYDDLSKITLFLAKNSDKERCETIKVLMETYRQKNKGTLEQIYAYTALVNYYRYFGEYEKTIECYEKLNSSYCQRIKELEGTQLDVHKRMKSVDNEVQQLKKSMLKKEEIYSLEPLTKLLNRSALLKVSSEFIESSLKRNNKVGGIFIDIDFFKECNDTYGHAKGDEIIKIVAEACKAEEKANIKFARYGGDEFFGITKGLNDFEVIEIAKRIFKKIKDANIPNEKNPNGHIITLSAGVVNVTITNKTDTIIEIANYADKAVYFAKSNGKNAIYMLKYDSSKTDGNNSQYIKIDF